MDTDKLVERARRTREKIAAQVAADPPAERLVPQLRARITELEAQLQQARLQGLEEAASECERLALAGDAYERECAGDRSWYNITGLGQRRAAEAIRKLKETN